MDTKIAHETSYSLSLRALVVTLALSTASVGLAQTPSELPNFNRRTPIVVAVENVGPSVVNIRSQDAVYRRGRNFDFFQRPRNVEQDPKTGRQFADRSLGSGVIIHPDGYLVTNDHVISGADRIRVKMKDGRVITARLLNSNSDNDLAILKLEGPGPYPYAQIGDSDKLMVGEPTIALGNPFGLSNSVTDGILSATNREVRFRNRVVFSDFLQTSAMINPGNSGGPLLDINGRVIGISVAIDNRGPGIGYAIPINRVQEVITTLLEPEMTKQAWLGIEPGFVAGKLVVARVDESGPAAGSGLAQGDQILSVDGFPVLNPLEFNVALQKLNPGSEVALKYQRDNRTSLIKVPFMSLPLEALTIKGDRATLLGMTVANLTHAAASRLHIPTHIIGPVILSVEPGSAADKIGVRKGDVVVEVGRVATGNVSRLTQALRYYQRGGSARISVYRENEGAMKGTIAF